MPMGLIERNAERGDAMEEQFYGVTPATVIDCVNRAEYGMVQIEIAWLPDFRPWARVAVPMAGPDRGAFFIPQDKDEVLVAFNQGDMREPYIIGSLWNGVDRPPVSRAEDAINKRIIRTPRGHEVEFDDQQESITITSSTQQTVTIDPEKIEIKTSEGGARFRMDKNGNVSLKAAERIELNAPTVVINGSDEATIESGARASIYGGEHCVIRAGQVNIN